MPCPTLSNQECSEICTVCPMEESWNFDLMRNQSLCCCHSGLKAPAVPVLSVTYYIFSVEIFRWSLNMAPPGKRGKRYLLGDNSPSWENTKELLKKQKVETEAHEELIKEAKEKFRKEQEARAAVIPSPHLLSKKTKEEFVNAELVVEDGIYLEESLMVNPLWTLRHSAAKLDPVELKAAREEAVAKAKKEKNKARNRRNPVPGFNQ